MTLPAALLGGLECQPVSSDRLCLVSMFLSDWNGVMPAMRSVSTVSCFHPVRNSWSEEFLWLEFVGL